MFTSHLAHGHHLFMDSLHTDEYIKNSASETHIYHHEMDSNILILYSTNFSRKPPSTNLLPITGIKVPLQAPHDSKFHVLSFIKLNETNIF